MSDSWLPRNSSPPGSSVHGISQQQYWSGLPFSYLGDKIFPTRGSNPHFQHLLYWQVDSFNSEPPGSPRVYPNTIVNVLLMFFGGGAYEGQQALLLSSHSGPASTPSSCCLMVFLPNGHFLYSDTIHFIQIRPFPPCYSTFPHSCNVTK